MGQGALRRRDCLLTALAPWLAACQDTQPPTALRAGAWVGANAARGHRLRAPVPSATAGTAATAATPSRRCQTLIIGAGVAGLACARSLARQGHADVMLLELEDHPGGNSRSHQMGGMACPLGAHYLPVPGPDSAEVYRLLEELGLVQQSMGRAVYDERHLCHSPQERLFFEGQWHEGLLPPALYARTRDQYLKFSRAVSQAQQQVGFSMPTHRAGWTAAHAALDAQRFSDWLKHQGLDDAQLLWYLDYCCRDDFGAGTATVSAWAGLHYFASRHGFHPPGDEVQEREAVLTWPEGNAFLTDRMAAALPGQVQCGHTVLKIDADAKHGVDALVWHEPTQTLTRWHADQLVLATPLFIAHRLLGTGHSVALNDAVGLLRYAPWLVANLQLRGPLLQRVGAPPAWDNVAYGSAALGYVDAMHQSLQPAPGATILTAYWALPEAQRPELLAGNWQTWAERMLAELRPLHPDLPSQLQRVDLMRWGHAMSIPYPGVRGSAALRALQLPASAQAKVHFAHADLSAYSVFEEAYAQGSRAAAQVLKNTR